MDQWIIIMLVVVALIAIGALVYWTTRGKQRKVEQQREEATEHRREAQSAAQRAGEAEVAARRQAEEAEREREQAVGLERKAAEADPDRRT